MGSIGRAIVVPRPLEEVFAFFSDARNLALLTPGILGFRMLDGAGEPMREGLRLTHRVRILGVPTRWTSRILVWDPPHRFMDDQLRGPFREWHHEHSFRPVPGGTEVRDRVRYALPLGPLGRLADLLFVRWQVRLIFAYRERRMRELFSDSAGATT